LKGLGASIKKYDSYGFENDESLMDLLCSLLDLNPKKRIQPSEALRHPFFFD
jgi:serine/threonine protein kinase